jgi:SAM-dependent methyltransferase
VDKIRTKAWFEVWFDSPYYSLLYNNRNENEARQFIDVLLQFLKPQSGSAMLDIACGSGRHAKYLSSMGFDVTGIDLSGNSIRQAKQFEHRFLHFYVHDMRHLFRINFFDFIFNFFTSFGYFENDADNIKALKAIGKGLKDDGTLVIDFFNAVKVKNQLPFQAMEKRNLVEFFIDKKLVNGFIEKNITVTDKGQTFQFKESVQAITLKQFEYYFEKSGLNLLQVFGGYELEEYDETNSERLIMICNKKHA